MIRTLILFVTIIIFRKRYKNRLILSQPLSALKHRMGDEGEDGEEQIKTHLTCNRLLNELGDYATGYGGVSKLIACLNLS